MINKVTYREEPTLFDNIDLTEFSVDNEMDHRRGSNFFRYDIIELLPSHKEYYPEIEDFDKYLGTWKTDTVIWDDTYGWDDKYSELVRVREKEVVTYKWEEVNE